MRFSVVVFAVDVVLVSVVVVVVVVYAAAVAAVVIIDAGVVVDVALGGDVFVFFVVCFLFGRGGRCSSSRLHVRLVICGFS